MPRSRGLSARAGCYLVCSIMQVKQQAAKLTLAQYFEREKGEDAREGRGVGGVYRRWRVGEVWI